MHNCAALVRVSGGGRTWGGSHHERSETPFLTIAGVVLLLAAAAAAEQAKPAVNRRRSHRAPSDEGATPGKLVAPVRGEAELGYTKPVSKRDGNMIVTTIKVKNLSTGAIAGLKVDEFWYDKAGDPVTGAQPFRYRKPLQPGEVIDVDAEGADQSEDGPEPVQVRARQRHDQDDEAAEVVGRRMPVAPTSTVTARC